ncbi:MAG: conjugal transfer protein TraH [Burkholderiales bacterium]
MFKKTVAAMMVMVAATLGSSIATADTQSEMQSWFNSMGGYSNVTGSQVVNGQTSTTYTGGNMFVRTPIQNYQMVSASPPSINAGCGGIDLFAGSFSFINSAQLTALLRNIGNNAVNYAFMLAIKTASPEMADLLQYLQDQASKLNNLNVNSCHAAEGIVNAVGSAITDGTDQANAQGTGSTVSNLWSDSFQSYTSWEQSSTAKQQARAAASAADPNLAAELNPGNIVYTALQKSNVPADMYPLMMGLVGAIVILPPGTGSNTNGSQTKWSYIPPTGLSFKDFIGDPSVQTTTSLQGLVCDEPTQCLNPSAQAMNADSLSYEVEKTVTTGMTNIQNRQAQTFGPSDYTLFTNTTIPLYKLARIAAMNNNPAMASDYAQVIAIDLAYKWMVSVLQNINAVLATSATTAQSPDVVQASEKLAAQIEKQTQLATLEYQGAYKKVTAEIDLQQNLKKINDEMVDAFSPTIQNSVMKYSHQ